MKRKRTIRAILGITQQEIAMILKISRSQWSLYELNLRNLPSAPSKLLFEMLVYMENNQNKVIQEVQFPNINDAKTKLLLEKKLKENKYHLMRINRQINFLREKIETYEKKVLLISYLNSQSILNKEGTPKIPLSLNTTITNLDKTRERLNELLIEMHLLEAQRNFLTKTIEIN